MTNLVLAKKPYLAHIQKMLYFPSEFEVISFVYWAFVFKYN